MADPQKIDISAGIVSAQSQPSGKIDLSAGLKPVDISSGLVQQAAPKPSEANTPIATAIANRMKEYGEPYQVAVRHLQGERPENIVNPPKPELPIGEQIEQIPGHLLGGVGAIPFEFLKELQGPANELTGAQMGTPAQSVSPTLKKLATPPEGVAGRIGQIAGQVGAFEALPEEAVAEAIPGSGVGARAARGALKGGAVSKATGTGFAPGAAFGAGAEVALPLIGKAIRAIRKPAAEAVESGEPVGPSSGLNAMLGKSPAEAPQVAKEITPAEGRIAQNVDALSQKIDPAKIQSPVDMNRLLDAASNAVAKNPEIRNAPITFDEQQKLAQSLGMTDADLLGSEADRPFKAEELVAAKALSDASLTNVLNEARLADDPEHEQAFFEGLAKHQQIQDTIKARLSETGRALGAARNEPSFQLRNEALKYMTEMDPETRLAIARKIAAIPADDTGALSKIVSEIRPSTTLDKFNEGWMNGLLTGGAIAKKAVGDTTMLLKSPLEKMAGGDFGGAWHSVQGYLAGLGNAIDSFSGTFRNEVSQAHGIEFETPRAAIKGPLGYAMRLPMRTLAALTDFFHALNYSGELNSLAYKTASDEGLAREALRERAAELAANPTDEMKKAAFAYARRQTFQESTQVSRAFSQIRKLPLGRWAMPFVKTPLAIAHENIKFSPLGIIEQLAQKGPVDSQELGKFMLGTGAYVWAVHKAATGQITGTGPSNYQDRLRLEAQGWQPYSIKIGNKWISYRYWEPVAPVLAAAADFARFRKENPNADASTMLDKGFGIALRSVYMALPFAYTISNIVGAVENPHGAARLIAREAGSVIPTAVADAAHASDRAVRVPKYSNPATGIAQQIESRIPGLTQNVPALRAPALPPGERNVFHLQGPAIQRPASQFGGLNPFPVSTSKPGLARRRQEILQHQQDLNRNKLLKVLRGT